MPHPATAVPAREEPPTRTGKPTDTPAVTAVAAPPSFASHEELLRWLYADLTRLERVAAPTLLLHRYDDHARPLRGAAAAQAHEEALVAATGGTLVMDVESVAATAHFGTVMGTLRAGGGRLRPPLAVPFCGVWRFDAQGRLAEHWENVAVETSVVERWFQEEAAAAVAEAAKS